MSQSRERARAILHLTVDLLHIAATVIKTEGMLVAELIVEKGASILLDGRQPRPGSGSTETEPFSAED